MVRLLAAFDSPFCCWVLFVCPSKRKQRCSDHPPSTLFLWLPSVCRVGFNENLVRKGLLFLQTQGDLEYRRERRLVHRLK